jgi:hypothetical protein
MNEFQLIIAIGQAIIALGVIPLVQSIWSLRQSVNDLKFIMHTDFVSNSHFDSVVKELNEKIDNVKKPRQR